MLSRADSICCTTVCVSAHRLLVCPLPVCLQAISFVRPTRDNVTVLKRELRQPRFQSYHCCE